MFLRRKLTVMATVALLSTSLLAGCSSSGENSNGGSNGGGTATAAEVLANKNARAAISMIIDKQAYCDVILNNGSIPTSTFTGMGYEYNEEQAKELWEKAKEEVGFDTVEMELLTYDHDTGKRTGEYIQSELSDLEGLTVKVSNLPFKQKLERETNGEFDLAFSGWGADYPDPLTYLSTMQTGNQFSNQVGYNSEEYNKLIEEAMKLPITEGYAKFSTYISKGICILRKRLCIRNSK